MQLPADKPLGTYEVANVSISYKDMGEKRKIVLTDKVSLTLTQSRKEAEASIDKDVMSRVISLQAIEKNKAAMKLRDQGRIKAARSLYNKNAAFLGEQAAKLGAPALAKQAAQTKGYSRNLARGKNGAPIARNKSMTAAALGPEQSFRATCVLTGQFFPLRGSRAARTAPKASLWKPVCLSCVMM